MTEGRLRGRLKESLTIPSKQAYGAWRTKERKGKYLGSCLGCAESGRSWGRGLEATKDDDSKQDATEQEKGGRRNTLSRILYDLGAPLCLLLS